MSTFFKPRARFRRMNRKRAETRGTGAIAPEATPGEHAGVTSLVRRDDRPRQNGNYVIRGDRRTCRAYDPWHMTTKLNIPLQGKPCGKRRRHDRAAIVAANRVPAG
jgi:hypothetical protein